MAESLDPFALNIRGVTDLIESDTNKVQSSVDDYMEGADSERYDALTLDMDDKELLKLRDDWEGRYATYEAGIKRIFERNLESYLGKRKDGNWLTSEGPVAANLQFEAEETFLAAALAKNPEPVVWADNTQPGNDIADSVKTMLQFHADQLVLRRKLTLMARQWSIYHLGVLKYGWNPVINDVEILNRRIQDFIFDPTGFVDAYGDFSSYLGERITVTAEKLIAMYPLHEDYIREQVDGKLGTDCVYTEWWTDEYCFVTFKDEVLEKHKNQYFNYAENPENPDDMLAPGPAKAKNHFASPKKPYTFLSVYSLQEQPHDITGLVEQNIPNQNRITRRTDQIDYNARSANNGYAFSEDNFNQETAKQAANARKKGNPILIPSGGPIDKAILPLPAQDLPAGFFKALETDEDHLRSSWGIQGLAPTETDEDTTARGMILNQSHDTTRIGGGIGGAIEQVADNAFNWLVQLYYVFYDEPHFAAIMGSAKAVEYIQFSNLDLNRQLIVSVAPDSMKPKDEITNLNLAQTLFDKGAIGPKTLLKMVEFPDADDAAADGVMYRLDPQAYFQLNFPEYAAKLQQQQQQNAMVAAQTNAMGAGMEAQASAEGSAAGTPPEQTTEPPQPISEGNTPSTLNQVPLPPLPQA